MLGSDCFKRSVRQEFHFEIGIATVVEVVAL